MKGRIRLWIIFTLMLVICGTGSFAENFGSGKGRKAGSSSTSSVSVDTLLSLRFLIDATRAWILEDYRQAEALARQALEADPFNAAAHYLLAQIYFVQGSFSQAFQHIRKAVWLDSTNFFYWRHAGLICMAALQPDCARQALWKAFQIAPYRVEIYEDLFRLLMLAEDWERMEELMDTLEQHPEFSDVAILMRARMLYRQEKKEEAMKFLEEHLDQLKEHPEAYAMLFHMMLEVGDTTRAEEILIQWLEQDTFQIPSLAAGVYLSIIRDRQEDLHQFLIRLIRSTEIELNEKLMFLGGVHPLHDQYRSLVLKYRDTFRAPPLFLDSLHLIGFLDTLTRLFPEDLQVWMAAGQIAYMAELPLVSIRYFRHALQLDYTRLNTWLAIAQIYVEEQQWDSAQSVLADALEYFSMNAQLHAMMTYVCYRQREHACVVRHGEMVLRLAETGAAVEDEQMLFIKTLLADAYYWNGQKERSFATFEELLRMNPDDPVLMNNYAYYLSLEGERLRYARSLIRKAIRLQPNTPAFEDTYGWILFKMGKIRKARKWIERALSHGGKSADIYDHYGDILYEMGEVDKAIQYWEKAIEAGGNEEEIRAKIQRARPSSSPASSHPQEKKE